MKTHCDFIIFKLGDFNHIISQAFTKKPPEGSYLEVDGYPTDNGFWACSAFFRSSPSSLKLKQVGNLVFREATCEDMTRHNLLSHGGAFYAPPTLKLRDLETSYIDHVLNVACSGNRESASESLGVSLKTIYNRLVKNQS